MYIENALLEIESPFRGIPLYWFDIERGGICEVNDEIDSVVVLKENTDIHSFLGELSVGMMFYEHILFRTSFDPDVVLRKGLCRRINSRKNEKYTQITDVDVYIHDGDYKEGVYFEVLTNGSGSFNISKLTKGSDEPKWSFVYDEIEMMEETRKIVEGLKGIYIVVFLNSEVRDYYDQRMSGKVKMHYFLLNERDKIMKRGIDFGIIIMPYVWNKKKEWPESVLLKTPQLRKVIGMFEKKKESLDVGEIYNRILKGGQLKQLRICRDSFK